MFRLNIGIVVRPALPRRYRKAVETAVSNTLNYEFTFITMPLYHRL